MPPAKKRRSPLDRFTDASPTAISAGFSAAMSLGPQPRPFGGTASSPSGSNGSHAAGGSGIGEGLTGTLQSIRNASSLLEDDGSDDDGSDQDGAVAGNTTASSSKQKPRKTKRKKTADDGDLSRVNLGDAGDEEEAARNRKAQNRIAQREFRQRKQQYIRALEARVELLSSDHDTQVDRLRYALRGLLAENNTLREMLGSLAAFIGEQTLGGPLQQTGVSRDELLEMIEGRSEKTMTQAWQNWPGAKECEALKQIRQEANIPVDGLPDMRASPGPSSGRAAAARKNTQQGESSKQPQPQQQPQQQQQQVQQPNVSAAANNPPLDNGQRSAATNPQTASPTSFLHGRGDSGAASSILSYNNANGSGSEHTSMASPMLNTALSNASNFNQPVFTFPNASGQTPQQQQQQQSHEDALMAGLLAGGDNFYNDGFAGGAFSTGTPLGGNHDAFGGFDGNFNSNVAMQGHTPSSFGPPLPSAAFENTTFGQQPPQQQQQLPSRTQTPRSSGHNANASVTTTTASPAHSSSSSVATPRTAFQTSAMQFLTSLRSVEKNDDVQRLTAIGQQLNRLRVAQGQPEFHALGAELAPQPELDSSIPSSALETTTNVGGPITEEEMHRMTDACIQTAYHMSNYRRNASYRLPALLRPTDLQLTRPHDPIVDTIPFAGLRDAIILQHDRINVEELMFHFFNAVIVADGDVYNQSTWMVSDSFLKRYAHLGTPDVLEATNRWRKSKGLDAWTFQDVAAIANEAASAKPSPAQGQSEPKGKAAGTQPQASSGHQPAPTKTGRPRGRPRKSREGEAAK